MKIRIMRTSSMLCLRACLPQTLLGLHEQSVGYRRAYLPLRLLKLDKGNIEENKKNLGPNLRPRAQRQGDKKAVLTEFICKNCNRPFDSQRGLSLHDTRHCKMKTDRMESVLEGKRSIVVQDGLDGIQAQHHKNTIWHQARKHTMSKHPPPLIADLQGKPRLKLPHVQDSKKWNKLDYAIFKAVVRPCQN